MKSVAGITAVVILCIGVTAGAQTIDPASAGAKRTGPDAGPVWNLKSVLQEALEHSPGILASGHMATAARDTADARFRELFGRLDAVASYSLANDHQVLRPMSREMVAGGLAGVPFDRNQFHYGVVFKLPLYMGGKRYAGLEIARLQADKAAALSTGSRWQVRFNVTSLYTGAQGLDEVGHALDEQIEALTKTLERLSLMVREGKRPEIDRLKVVESLEELRSKRADIRADRARVGAMLLALMGRDPTTGFRVEAIHEGTPVVDLDSNGLQALVSDTSAVREARLAALQAENGVDLTLGDFLPHLSASANWMGHYGTTSDDPMNTWGVMVVLDVPLLAGGARFADLAAARERLDAAREAQRRAELQASADLEDALAGFSAAKSRVESARARVNVGVEAARIEQIRYDTGAGTIEDLLRARAREEQARASFALSLARFRTAAEKINLVVEKEVVR